MQAVARCHDLQENHVHPLAFHSVPPPSLPGSSSLQRVLLAPVILWKHIINNLPQVIIAGHIQDALMGNL